MYLLRSCCLQVTKTSLRYFKLKREIRCKYSGRALGTSRHDHRPFLKHLGSSDLCLQSLCITVEVLNSGQKELGVCPAMFQEAKATGTVSGNSNQMLGAQPSRSCRDGGLYGPGSKKYPRREHSFIFSFNR